MLRLANCARTPSALLALLVSMWGTEAPLQAQSPSYEKTSVIPINQVAGKATGLPFEVRTLKPGDSSRRQRQEALNQLPLHLLSVEGRIQAREITKSVSMFRRLPLLELDADRRCYEFFCAHPDVAVSIWRALDISNVQMWQSSPSRYEVDTQDGTTGTVEILLNHPEHAVVICHGQFQSPALPRPVKAHALMHLQPKFQHNGKVQHQVDLFVAFPSTAVETIARIVSPLSYRIADRNFEEISLFVEMMSAGMERQPGWVEQIAARLDGVLSGRAEELLSITASVYVDAERRKFAEAGSKTTVDLIMPPVQSPAAGHPVSAPTTTAIVPPAPVR